MPEFVKPTVEFGQLWPLVLVLGAACVGVLIEAFLPRRLRFGSQVGVALVALLAAGVGTILVGRDLKESADGLGRGSLTAQDTIAVDGPAVLIWGLLIVIGILGLLLFAERQLDGGLSAFSGQAAALPGSEAERDAQTASLEHTEVYPLMLFALGGMMLFASANDLLTMFVALEVLSLPLYLLCGLARRRRLLSQEAAMKYFLLGAFSSGFFLYGVALIYGYAGSMQFSHIAEMIRNDTGQDTLLLIGLGMLTVGLLFKVGAAPFHAWTPDVYQGAPTPVTAFMAAATKVAAFAAFMRMLYVAFGDERWNWQPMMAIIAVLTMVVGTVLALTQTDVKRLLAYSAIAHTGFILTGVLGVQAVGEMAEGQLTSMQAVIFYLASYAFSTLAAFALVTLVRDSAGEATSLARWRGLGREEPLVAGVMAFLLLAMAGIPLTSGFVGKWAVFTVAASAGAWWVVVAAVIASAVAAYIYVKVIVAMFAKPVGDGPTVAAPSVLTATTIAVGAGMTLVLGVLPGPLLDLAAHAGEFIR